MPEVTVDRANAQEQDADDLAASFPASATVMIRCFMAVRSASPPGSPQIPASSMRAFSACTGVPSRMKTVRAACAHETVPQLAWRPAGPDARRLAHGLEHSPYVRRVERAVRHWWRTPGPCPVARRSAALAARRRQSPEAVVRGDSAASWSSFGAVALPVHLCRPAVGTAWGRSSGRRRIEQP